MRPSISIFAALALTSASIMTGSASGQDTGVVRGRVIDAGSGDPVATAAVKAVGTVLITFADDSGRFELRGVPVGRRSLEIERIGYKPHRLEVRVRAGLPAEVEVALQPSAVAVGQIVVSATKRELSSFDAPVSVAVLEERDIRARVPETTADAVSYVPSVQFVGEQLNVRGSSGYSRGTGTRVLLLVDGVPANAGDSGGLNWDMIPLTEVSRIEVVKGAGSALYGSSALGGVVNVVTMAPPESPLTRVRLRAGFYDDPKPSEWIWSNQTRVFGSIEASHGRHAGPLELWIRGGRSEDDGFRENADRERTNVAFQAGVGGDRDSLKLLGSWARERYGASLLWCMRGECGEDPEGLAFQPLRVPSDAADDRTRSDKGFLHLTHRRRWSDALESFERMSLQRNDWDTDFGDEQVGAVADRLGGELRLGWSATSWLHLILGGEGSYTDVDADLFGTHSATDGAAFIQGELGVTRWLMLTAGARADLRYIDGGSLTEPWSSQLSPRLGAVASPDPLTRLRASAGRGFRAPTVAELFTATEVGGFLVIPNEDLRPERSWSGEVGLTRLLTSWLSVDIAGFGYDFTGLIEADTVVGETGSIEVRFDNLPAARLLGLEAIGRLSLWGDRLFGQAAYTFLSSEDESTGRPLAYRPDHLLTASGYARLGSFELGADYRFASAFDRVQVFTDPRLDPRVPMRVLGLRLAYRLGEQVFRFSVDNALNHSYTTIERNLEPIRRATFSLDVEF